MRFEDMAFNTALIAYLIAAILYLTGFLTNKDLIRRGARVVVWTGLASHTGTIVARTLDAGRLPLANLYEYGLLFGWGILVGFLILELRGETKGLDVAASVLVFLIMCFISMLSREASPLMPALRSNWLTFHVISAIIAYSAFAISFGGAVLHLMKISPSPVLEGLRRRLPDAELLDQITYKAVVVGLPFQTLTLVTGAIWAHYAWGSYWSWDPKETWSLITWLIYSAYLHARYVWGWKGKSSAYLSVIGFGVVIFTFVGVTYLLTGQHSYA